MQSIYEITNRKNNRVYVGCTKNPSKRWTQHLSDLRRGVHPNKKLQKDFFDCGESYFKFEVIAEVEDSMTLTNKMEYVAVRTIIKEKGEKGVYNEYPTTGRTILIIDKDTKKEYRFSSQYEAAKFLGMDRTSIITYLRCKNNTCVYSGKWYITYEVEHSQEKYERNSHENFYGKFFVIDLIGHDLYGVYNNGTHIADELDVQQSEVSRVLDGKRLTTGGYTMIKTDLNVDSILSVLNDRIERSNKKRKTGYKKFNRRTVESWKN